MTPLVVAVGAFARQIDAADPPARLTAVVGERVAVHFINSPLPCELRVVEAPAPPDVEGNAFTPNAPGLYAIGVGCGTWTAIVRLFAVWPSLLEHPQLATFQTGIDRGRVRPGVDRWHIVEAIVADRDFPAVAFAAATPQRPLPAGVSLQQFGG